MREGLKLAVGCVLGAVLGAGATAWAAAKTYQYTGVVKQASAKELSVDKGGEVWSFALDGETKGDLKVKAGDKVTVTYRMFATRIEAKK